MHNTMYSPVQMRRMESVRGKVIKQSIGLNKRSHNAYRLYQSLLIMFMWAIVTIMIAQ